MADAPSTDVNEQVQEEWVTETTPYERLRTVMKRTYEPQTADIIAERARTSPKTARKHLDLLVDEGFVEKTGTPDSKATHYKRANSSLVSEQAANILRNVDPDTLVARISEMQSRVDAFREEYGVESPEDAAIRGKDLDEETRQEWQTTRRNLGFAKVALALSEADDAVEDTNIAQ